MSLTRVESNPRISMTNISTNPGNNILLEEEESQEQEDPQKNDPEEIRLADDHSDSDAVGFSVNN